MLFWFSFMERAELHNIWTFLSPSPVSWVSNSQGNGGVMWHWCIYIDRHRHWRLGSYLEHLRKGRYWITSPIFITISRHFPWNCLGLRWPTRWLLVRKCFPTRSLLPLAAHRWLGCGYRSELLGNASLQLRWWLILVVPPLVCGTLPETVGHDHCGNSV